MANKLKITATVVQSHIVPHCVLALDCVNSVEKNLTNNMLLDMLLMECSNMADIAVNDRKPDVYTSKGAYSFKTAKFNHSSDHKTVS